MSNKATHDSSSSVNQKLSENEIMQMVFIDLRSNRPKPLDGCDFNSLPVHRRFISLPNMAVRTNPAAKVTEFGWKSMPNITLPAVDNFQESKQKSSEIGDFPSLLVHERAVSCPNMALLKNSAAEALETGCKSTPNIILPVNTIVDDIRENGQKPSENCDFHSLPVNCKRSVSFPNMAVGANSSGDAPEIGLPRLVTSAELPAVTIDSPCTGSSISTLMTLDAPVEDSGIETSLSVVSSSLLRLQKIEADMQLIVTDTVTCVGRSDEGTVTAVTPRRPRRSVWSRTKKFVRRMFCCGAMDHADV